jgi:hypothetical protein
MPKLGLHMICGWRDGEWFLLPTISLYVDGDFGKLLLDWLRVELGVAWWYD